MKDTKIGPNEIHLAVSNPKREKDEQKYHVVDHSRNFLDCIRSRQDPVAQVEIGNSTANVCHLGNIAMLLHRKIRLGPAERADPWRRRGQRAAESTAP